MLSPPSAIRVRTFLEAGYVAHQEREAFTTARERTISEGLALVGACIEASIK